MFLIHGWIHPFHHYIIHFGIEMIKNSKNIIQCHLEPQAHDIIRTWAFYTILRCTLLTDEKPFENMMMGGFILSEDGTPMHASLR